MRVSSAAAAGLLMLAACGDHPLVVRSENGLAVDEPPLPVGRFAIVHSPHSEADTMLLDTMTGRTWQLTSSKPGNPNGDLGWTQVPPPPTLNQ